MEIDQTDAGDRGDTRHRQGPGVGKHVGRHIRTSAPTRFDFAGAPTDVEPFRSEEGGLIVNAALGMRVSASVSISAGDAPTVVTSLDLGIEETVPAGDTMDRVGPLGLLKAAIGHVGPGPAVHVRTRSEAPRGSGLGASAALAVAVLCALRRVDGAGTSAHHLAREALYVENVLLGNTNGGQDQFAAALGGFHALRFGPDDIEVRPLCVDNDVIRSLEERSVLCYSGESHLSGRVLDQIMADYRRGDRRTVAALRRMKRIAEETMEALVTGRLDDLGTLVGEAGAMQRQFHPAVTPPAVERVCEIGRDHGALGAKMAGAGGGGCVYLLCPPGRAAGLRRALATHGIRVLPVRFSPTGVVTDP